MKVLLNLFSLIRLIIVFLNKKQLKCFVNSFFSIESYSLHIYLPSVLVKYMNPLTWHGLWSGHVEGGDGEVPGVLEVLSAQHCVQVVQVHSASSQIVQIYSTSSQSVQIYSTSSQIVQVYSASSKGIQVHPTASQRAARSQRHGNLKQSLNLYNNSVFFKLVKDLCEEEKNLT